MAESNKPNRLKLYEYLSGAVLVVIGVLGLLNAFFIPSWISFNAFVQTALSTLLIALGIERFILLHLAYGSLGAFSDRLKANTDKGDQILGILHQVREDVRANDLERHWENINPCLASALDDEILGKFKSLILDGEVTLEDSEAFFRFYVGTLKFFTDKHTGSVKMVATSLPTEGYFWKEAAMNAVKVFVEKGGQMERVFLVDSIEKLKANQKRIIENQRSFDIDTYVVDKSTVSPNLRSTFIMAIDSFDLAWEVETDETGSFKRTRITTNRARIDSLRKQIDNISKHKYPEAIRESS